MPSKNLKDIDWTKFRRNKRGKVVPLFPEKKEKVLNKNELLFAREYIKDGNATRAYSVAYPGVKYNTAKQLGSRKVKSMSFSNRLDKHGVTDSLLAEVLKEGLAATRTHSSPTGPDTEEKDFKVRHDYLETALKVKGHMSNITAEQNIQVNILDYKEND